MYEWSANPPVLPLPRRAAINSTATEEASVLSQNPQAGAVRAPTSPAATEGVLRATELWWAAEPYVRLRFGERGRAFLTTDGGFLAAQCEGDEAQVCEQAAWLCRVLANRGNPTVLIERYLRLLHRQLSAIDEVLPGLGGLVVAADRLAAARSKHLDHATVTRMAEAFAVRTGGPSRPWFRGAGELVIAAVADERDGAPNAVTSLLEWMADDAQFPVVWCVAVRDLVSEAESAMLGLEPPPAPVPELCNPTSRGFALPTAAGTVAAIRAASDATWEVEPLLRAFGPSGRAFLLGDTAWVVSLFAAPMAHRDEELADVERLVAMSGTPTVMLREHLGRTARALIDASQPGGVELSAWLGEAAAAESVDPHASERLQARLKEPAGWEGQGGRLADSAVADEARGARGAADALARVWARAVG